MHAIIRTPFTTCGENSRAAFSALSFRTTRRDFEGGDNSRCGEISSKYGIYARVYPYLSAKTIYICRGWRAFVK